VLMNMRQEEMFDLSSAAQLHYHGVVRLPRLAAVAFLVFFAGIVVWRTATIGFTLILVPVILLLGFLAWVIVFYMVPGPTKLRAVSGSIEFVYPGGRIRRVLIDGLRLPIELVEVIPRESPLRFDIMLKDASEFVKYGREWIAVTKDAFEYIEGEARDAGYITRISVRPNYPTGGWRFHQYSRVAAT